MADYSELRQRHAEFWERASLADITTEDEHKYWDMCSDALPELLDEIERLRGTQTPAAWMVIRDSFEPPEVFVTEEAARKNACLGVCDTHVYPLFHHNSCAYSGHENRIAQLEAALREIADMPIGANRYTPSKVARSALEAKS